MRVKKEIAIGNILVDRWAIDEKTLRYAKLLESGVQFPAIKVARKVNGQFVIRDGRHRIVAHKLTGRRKILAKFSTKALRQ